LMLDIDHFKQVNDRFGHAAGDRVLRAIAVACQAAKRDADVIARVGGEEFALLLPETTDAAALQFAERLRRQLHDCSLTVDGEKVPITVSIGVAGANNGTLGIEALLQCADHALYEAKGAGRDRVTVWRPPVPADLPQAAA
jgi:diguanylate cyclase (GGDEF)-like protein